MLYALHDYDINLKKLGAFPIHENAVEKYNKVGYGIFWTPNDFKGRRIAENCSKINYWLADIDEGAKPEQLKRIKVLPLKPTMIIETKKGYHCYWRAEDATLEKYKSIERGLIEKLNADKGCKDVCRLLRYPGSYHMKNPEHPYKIRVIEDNEIIYSEKKMLCAYEVPEKQYVKSKNGLIVRGCSLDFKNPENWEKLFKVSEISEGGRNNTFARYIFWLKDLSYNYSDIEYIISGLNSQISNPLPYEEMQILFKSKGII